MDIGAIFVGREKELAALNGSLSFALKGQTQVIFLSGEAGSGKTALISQFSEQAQKKHSELLVAAGACDSQSGAGEPYLPFREILAMLAGDAKGPLRRKITNAENASRLRKFLSYSGLALVEVGPDLLDVLIPGYGVLLSAAAFAAKQIGLTERIERSTQSRRSIPKEIEPGRIAEQYAKVLQQMIKRQPFILILDDMQWTDAASADLLLQLGRRLTEGRLLIIASYRPDEIEGERAGLRHPFKSTINNLTRYINCLRIELDYKQAGEDAAFIDAYLNAYPNLLGQDFRQSMLAHTRGNPLFIRELIENMLEANDLQFDAGRRLVARPGLTWGNVPNRVEGVFEERVERLERRLQDILSVASVEGADFTAQVVARVLESGEREILEGLSEDLEKRFRLVNNQGERQLTSGYISRYQFSTLLLQKYLYERLSPPLKRVYHASIAAALEQVYGDLCGEIIVPLAEHYAAAQDGQKAVPLLIEAGDRARLLYANQEAVRHYRRALDFLEKSSQYDLAARTRMKLALTCHNAFDYVEARRNFNEGFRLWQLAGEAPCAAPPSPATRPLRMDWPYQPLTLDPALADDGDSVGVIDQLFSGLMDLGQRLELMPGAAESWEILDGGRRYIFHLRADGRWSDGAPVTAQDFVFAWQRALDPAAQSLTARQLYDIQGARALHGGASSDPGTLGARALDDLTLEVSLEQPSSAFLFSLAFTVSYPAPRHTIARHGPAWTDPGNLVGNGPFCLESWQQIGEQEGRLVLARSPTFSGASSGNLQRVELISLPTSAKRLAAYEKDHLDVLSLRDFPDARRARTIDRQRVRARHAGEYLSAPFLATSYVGFNLHKPPFTDLRLRLALIHAADRERYADELLHGFAFPATGGFVPAGMPGHSPEIGLKFDPPRARALLNAAGFSNPADFPKIEFLTGPDPEGQAAYLAEGWREHLGLSIKAVEMDWEEFSQRLQDDPPDLFLDIWMADFPDPDNFLRASDALRWLRWNEPRYWALVEEARAAADQEQRLALYRHADRRLIDQAALAPIKYLRSHFLLKPWVKRFPTSSNEWWYCKDVVLETVTS